MARWIARNSDGMWMVRGAGEPAQIHTQPASFTEVDVPGDDVPDPRIERYDPSTPSRRRAATAPEIAAYDTAVLDAEVATAVDQQRLTSAVVWAVIDTYSAPATPAKYQAARTKIVTAYKAKPWNP
jgi:hypothetical protein